MIIHDDCLTAMRGMPDNAVHAIVTDPPYALTAHKKGGSGAASIDLGSPYGRARIGTGNGAGGFMGKKWDGAIPGPEIWAEAVRVARPGCHLLAFGGDRTHHRLMVAIEDAGWELRTCIYWVFGSGFPKSRDVSKDLDKAAGVDREDKFEGAFERHSGPTGNKRCEICGKWLVSGSPCQCPRPQDEPKSDLARTWKGWGTALKPAAEIIVVARKSLDGTVAQNVQKWGCGALNIDASRIRTDDKLVHGGPLRTNSGDSREGKSLGMFLDGTPNTYTQNSGGRWPTNLIHDGSQLVLDLFPDSNSTRLGGNKNNPRRGTRHTATSYGQGDGKETHDFRDSGSAARFFYAAKASRRERELGCEDMAPKSFQTSQPYGSGAEARRESNGRGSRNDHPTIKPLALMTYLCRLVTPPRGTILDPFMGSGTTGMAAKSLGFDFIGIEREKDYCEIAERRIAAIDPPAQGESEKGAPSGDR